MVKKEKLTFIGYLFASKVFVEQENEEQLKLIKDWFEQAHVRKLKKGINQLIEKENEQNRTK